MTLKLNKMNQVIIKYCKYRQDYTGVCDLLEGWIAAEKGPFDKFKAFVKDSLDNYVQWCKYDNEPYPDVLDGDYELVFVETKVNEDQSIHIA